MTQQLDEASPEWCLRLIAEFNSADERATVLAKTLTSRQLNWRSRPGEWSVGQCLEHLCLGNDMYFGAIASSLDERPQVVVEKITPGWFGRSFIRNYIEPSPRTWRVRAPRKITPAAELGLSVLDRFLGSNQRARELVHRASKYDVNRIRFKNPFIPVIRFTVGTGLEILSKHEQRHLLQAERVKQSVGFPAPEAES